ncbi:zinc finger protein 236 [Chrysoperla carnea]|uniref:zinc finger protein 236 n=1 Tax=Chrysoperla carnea TaxID=189513 RepID=UPI001D091A29|nr:zinc finger protein 236 [Chrysoperla carnea]
MSGYKRVNYYELCRLCTSSEGVKIHIFCEDGKRRQLQNKIQICLPLQVCEDDSLPKIVCAGCLEKIEYFYDFRESCVTSEGMLESYFTSMRYSDDLLRERKVYIKESDKSRSKSKPLPQSLLNQQQNTMNEDQTQSQNQPQTVINQNITTSSQQTQHQTPTNHQTIQQNIPNIINTTNTKQQNSNIQTTQLTNLEIISQQVQTTQQPQQQQQQHVQQNQHDNSIVTQQLTQDSVPQQHTQQIIPQFMISLTRPGNEILQWQIKDNGLSERFKILDQLPAILTQNICLKCRQIFLNTDDLTNHICSAVESPPSYIIPDTEIPETITTTSTKQQQTNGTAATMTTSSTSTTLDIQKAILSSLDQIDSSNSKDNKTTNQQKIISLKTSTDNNSTSDESKSTTVNSTATVTTMTTSSTSTTPITTPPKHQFSVQNGLYMCDTCDKTFKRKEHLMQHRKLHSGERPFVCDKCQKSFSRKEHLIRHSVSHTGEKCFECDQCHKSFSRKDNLHKHRRTHLPYICDICNKSFMFKHYYSTHKLTHLQEGTVATIPEDDKSKIKKQNSRRKEQSSPPSSTSSSTTTTPSKIKTDPENVFIQNGVDNIINLGGSTIKFTPTNNNTSDQIQNLIQSLTSAAAAQQQTNNVITANMNHLTVVQNLVPCTTDLTQLVNNNNNTVTNNNGTIRNGNGTTTPQTNLTLIEQSSKHLAQILTSQKYRDKYIANTNIKLEQNGDKNLITPTILNQGGIILLPTKSQNFISLNPQDLINVATQQQQSTSTSSSSPPSAKITNKSDIKSTSNKKVKYTQSNNFTNNTIVTNLNQIGGGKSNVLFSSSSSNKNGGIPTNVINNTIVNTATSQLNQQHLTNNIYQHHINGQQNLTVPTSSTSNAQFI